jgi:hypothetical protein
MTTMRMAAMNAEKAISSTAVPRRSFMSRVKKKCSRLSMRVIRERISLIWIGRASHSMPGAERVAASERNCRTKLPTGSQAFPIYAFGPRRRVVLMSTIQDRSEALAARLAARQATA